MTARGLRIKKRKLWVWKAADSQPPERTLDRVSYESGYIAAMMDVWRGLYASNEPALRTFIDRAWKATGAER